MAISLRELSRASLPTRYGDFTIVAFIGHDGGKIDDVALLRGQVAGASDPVPVRIHSECLTGDVLGSVRCDCGDQLHEALERLAAREQGVLLYLRQEGRGIGIANKVAAYALQDRGMDTVEANLHLGFDDDLRNYDLAAGMLRCLGIAQVELHTNNPSKLEGLKREGIHVARRVPLIAGVREENRFYLSTKRRRSGHLLDVDD